MKRLFFALWPDKQTRGKLHTVNAAIHLEGVRKLKPSNLHVTLLYLGNLEAKTRAEISMQVARIESSTFEFLFDGLEHWREPKTLCLTASHQPKALTNLVDQLVDIVKPYPIHIHDRPYRAHVTLTRKAKTDYALDFAPITWTATDFVLVESISTADGIVYEVLERWPLIAS